MKNYLRSWLIECALAVAFAVGVVALVAACGSSDSSSDAGKLLPGNPPVVIDDPDPVDPVPCVRDLCGQCRKVPTTMGACEA